MEVSWRVIAIVFAVIAAVIGLCALDLSCSGGGEIPMIARVKGEIRAGRDEQRIQQADELARIARDMRVLAKRYLEKGENRKTRRALGAAQELEKKIKELRGEN